MANSDAPFGLRPVNYAGQYDAGRVRPYYVAAGYGTALFIGDPVVKTGTSNTVETNGFIPGALPEIAKATAGDGNAITGAIIGFETLVTDLTKAHNPASTARVALVADDPYQIFEIQADGAIAAVDIGLNANLIYTHSGSTTYGLSGVELDTTSDAPAADASNQLLILGLAPRPDNEIGANAKVLVRINQHTEAPGALGI